MAAATRPLVTVVGGGVVGTQVAYRLLLSGRCKVRIIDAGDASDNNTPQARPNSQQPWGWHRRYSLQPKVKTGLGHLSHDIPFDNINLTRGPMLVTTKRESVMKSWNAWGHDNQESDAHVITPREAEDQYGIAQSYFTTPHGQTKGGVFVCDTRDCLIDYGALINRVWEYMHDHPDCEVLKNAPVEKLKYVNGKATAVQINGEEIGVDETLFCIGNQSASILPSHPPVINLSLPYGFLEPADSYKFVGLWNEDSTLSCFQDGSVKLSSGLLSMLSIKQTLQHAHTLAPMLPAFAKVLSKGITGLHIGWTTQNVEKQIYEKMFLELEQLGMLSTEGGRQRQQRPNVIGATRCSVDVTPSMCPYVDRLPYASNVVLATSFSGSGSLALDPWFSNAVADVLLSAAHLSTPSAQTERLLKPFKIPRSLKEFHNPHADLCSPISAMGSTD